MGLGLPIRSPPFPGKLIHMKTCKGDGRDNYHLNDIMYICFSETLPLVQPLIQTYACSLSAFLSYAKEHNFFLFLFFFWMQFKSLNVPSLTLWESKLSFCGLHANLKGMTFFVSSTLRKLLGFFSLNSVVYLSNTNKYVLKLSFQSISQLFY